MGHSIGQRYFRRYACATDDYRRGCRFHYRGSNTKPVPRLRHYRSNGSIDRHVGNVCGRFAGIFNQHSFRARSKSGNRIALLPLLGACTGAYIVSFFLMENTIMTEKIARRGIVTPDSFEPDILAKMHIAQVMSGDIVVINENNDIREVKNWLTANPVAENYLLAADALGEYTGIIKLADIFKNR